MTTTRAPLESSAAANGRPSAGRTCMTSKNPAVTTAPAMRSGRSKPVTSNVASLSALIAEKLLASRCQSRKRPGA